MAKTSRFPKDALGETNADLAIENVWRSDPAFTSMRIRLKFEIKLRSVEILLASTLQGFV